MLPLVCSPLSDYRYAIFRVHGMHLSLIGMRMALGTPSISFKVRGRSSLSSWWKEPLPVILLRAWKAYWILMPVRCSFMFMILVSMPEVGSSLLNNGSVVIFLYARYITLF